MSSPLDTPAASHTPSEHDMSSGAMSVIERWAEIQENFPVPRHIIDDSTIPVPGSDAPVYRVVISGGPCGGKTTTLAEVSDRLRSRGFGVYVVPEAATLFFTGGCSITDLSDDQVLVLQTSLLRTQMALEDNFFTIARASSKPSILLCDRGTMDGRAYMSSEMWSRMLELNGWDTVKLRDTRYDLVIHMVTAANGAEKFYQLANNVARSESIEHACFVDRKTQNAWVGHPHLHIIDNRTGFREKIERVFSVIAELVGVRSISKRDVRKYLLAERVLPRCLLTSIDNLEQFEVEQTFLKRGRVDGVQESVRRRGDGRSFTFVHKVRWSGHGNDGVYEETKRQITNREYLSLLSHADPDRRTVRILRQCFLYESRYFVLDTILNIDPVVQVIRTRVDLDEPEIQMPRWIKVDREVTSEPEWTMYAMSTRIKPERMNWPLTEAGTSEVERAGRNKVDQAMSL